MRTPFPPFQTTLSLVGSQLPIFQVVNWQTTYCLPLMAWHWRQFGHKYWLLQIIPCKRSYSLPSYPYEYRGSNYIQHNCECYNPPKVPYLLKYVFTLYENQLLTCKLYVTFSCINKWCRWQFMVIFIFTPLGIYPILFYLFLLDWIENNWTGVSAYIVCTCKHCFVLWMLDCLFMFTYGY